MTPASDHGNVALPPIPFGRVLGAGNRGRDVHAVTRTLARTGLGNLPDAKQVMTGEMVAWLRSFQRKNRLVVDGVYGPRTHARLSPLFDSYSFLLYTGKQPHPAPAKIQLPETFAWTHPTAGLEGFPAIDVLGPAGATVGAPAAGRVYKLSGHDPAEGGLPGLAYGWSVYIESAAALYYMTHFGTRIVRLGQTVARGDVLGTICDARVALMPSYLSHIHEGRHAR